MSSQNKQLPINVSPIEQFIFLQICCYFELDSIIQLLIQTYLTAGLLYACCFSLHQESTATYDPELAMCTESIRITLERNRIAQAKATTYKTINALSLHNNTKHNMNQLQTGIYVHEKHM